MTLLETINLIQYVAENQPNINSIIRSGDIFELNNDEYEQKYSVFCLTQRTHTFTDDFVTFNFTMFYVDRLMFDKSNKLDVQSTACEILMNICNAFKEKFYYIDTTFGEITTFTERFTSECAGAYMNISITTPKTSICAFVIKELGDFAPEPYSDDWFKVIERLY